MVSPPAKPGAYLYELLMDDANAELPRVRNVTLAVNLARHSAKDWDNPALPDDFAAIEQLLRIDRPSLMTRLGVPDNLAARYIALQQSDDHHEPR